MWWVFSACGSGMAIAQIVFTGLNGSFNKLKVKGSRGRINVAFPYRLEPIGNADDS